MKRLAMLALAWLAAVGFAAVASTADLGPYLVLNDGDTASAGERMTPAGQEPAPNRFSARWDYLRKEDATQREDYTRARLAFDGDNRFLHPRGGLEYRIRNAQDLVFWIGDDIMIKPDFWLHLRLNHTRYGEYSSAINFANGYISYQWRWVVLAVGLGYAALNFDDQTYWNPFIFNSAAPETRFIYEVSFRPTLWKDKLDLDLGFKNFDDFEYHGFDDNGYHVEPIFHLNPDTDLSYFYERRYAGAFISLPTVTRTTWMVSIEHRF